MIIYATKAHLSNFIAAIEAVLAYQVPTFQDVASKNVRTISVHLGMGYWLGPIGTTMLKVMEEVGEYKQAVTRSNLQTSKTRYTTWLSSMNSSSFTEVKFKETSIVDKLNGSQHALGVPILIAYKNSSGNWIEQQ